ncbi:hypothetical protein JTB14_000608 [Gonioctena quinquepunctata]|nr:hypothetical protein JTB14_000608 [Gonioctena quinquepunctata]
MTIDKFGRSSKKKPKIHPIVTPALVHTPDGDIDLDNVKLCNVKQPTVVSDAANKEYVDEVKTNFVKITQGIQSQLETLLVEIKNCNKQLAGQSLTMKTIGENMVTIHTNSLIHKAHAENVRKEIRKITKYFEKWTGKEQQLDLLLQKFSNDFKKIETQMKDSPTQPTDFINKKYVDSVIGVLTKNIQSIDIKLAFLDNMEQKSSEADLAYEKVDDSETLPKQNIEKLQ